MSRVALRSMDSSEERIRWPVVRRMAGRVRAATPALLFGLRLWAAVCLALYVAFWLELDNPSWAGTTAALVCQPSLGASLRKGWFRMIGTVVGATAIVVLTACFVQQRAAFLLGLALWGAVCGFMATILRNFAAYAAALAGYTAAIIASDELGAVGGANGQVFMLAVARASEICIGIVCAGIVLAGTNFGGARRRLAAKLAAISVEITGYLTGTFVPGVARRLDLSSLRRELVRRVIALDPIIDETVGEASDLRFSPRALQDAVDGLFLALAGWRATAVHLAQVSDQQGGQDANTILQTLPAELRSVSPADTSGWMSDPSRMRQTCFAAVRALVALPAREPSLRLLADQTAEGLLGISQALGGLVLLADPRRATLRAATARLRVPDLLPALVNGVRVLVTIVAVQLFWIVTAWPSGALAVTFAALTVILLSPQADKADAAAMSFMLGTSGAAVLAAIVTFTLLPRQETFAGLSIAIGLVLVPAGALVAQSWQGPLFTAMTANFIPIVAPANHMTYNTQQFYNTASAILMGVGAAMLALRLIRPLGPALRTRRLLTLTLRDLRRLPTHANPPSVADWRSLGFGRLSVLPDQAEPLQRAQLSSALSVGTQIIRVRRIVARFNMSRELEPTLDAIARGDSTVAITNLSNLDSALAALPETIPGARVRLRARGSIYEISETLARYPDFFDGEARL